MKLSGFLLVPDLEQQFNRSTSVTSQVRNVDPCPYSSLKAIDQQINNTTQQPLKPRSRAIVRVVGGEYFKFGGERHSSLRRGQGPPSRPERWLQLSG